MKLYSLLGQLFLLVLTASCTFQKNYASYEYEGQFEFLEHSSDNIHIRVFFENTEEQKTFQVLQVNEEGQIIPGFGSNVVEYQQDDKFLRFLPSYMVFQKTNGERIYGMINSAILDYKELSLLCDYRIHNELPHISFLKQRSKVCPESQAYYYQALVTDNDEEYQESIQREKVLMERHNYDAAAIERRAREKYLYGDGYTSTNKRKQVHYQGSEEQKRDLEMIDNYMREHPDF